MDDLPDGDFTKSELWPQIVIGLPDKNDIILVQNHIMAKHMVKESEKQEAAHALTTSNIAKLHKLITAMANNAGIDEDLLISSKPSSKRTAGVKKVNADAEVVKNLEPAFIKRVIEISADYAGQKYSLTMVQIRTAKVTSDNLIGKWIEVVEPKLYQDEKRIWHGLSDLQKELLYFATSKGIAEAAKGLATAKSGGSETGSNKRQRNTNSPMSESGATPTAAKRDNTGRLLTPYGAPDLISGDSTYDEYPGDTRTLSPRPHPRPLVDTFATGTSSPGSDAMPMHIRDSVLDPTSSRLKLSDDHRVISQALGGLTNIEATVAENEKIAAADLAEALPEFADPEMYGVRRLSDESDPDLSGIYDRGRSGSVSSAKSARTVRRRPAQEPGVTLADGRSTQRATSAWGHSSPGQQMQQMKQASPQQQVFTSYGQQQVFGQPGQHHQRSAQPGQHQHQPYSPPRGDRVRFGEPSNIGGTQGYASRYDSNTLSPPEHGRASPRSTQGGSYMTSAEREQRAAHHRERNLDETE
ncbi:hypothetical protein LTR17_022291 [Elasticomyces elasticus]|nr:hypothetical protein LTR17_022291 [Elasticomyces elasticus]